MSPVISLQLARMTKQLPTSHLFVRGTLPKSQYKGGGMQTHC